MSNVTPLLILWLLSEAPLHGYRIKKILDEPSLRFWFPVEVGSIYAALNSLAKGGYIVAEAVERQGLRPERTRYRILPEGRKHFRDLLRKAWLELPRIADPMQLALAARPELEESEVAGLLSERIGHIRGRLNDLEKAAPSAPAKELCDRQRMLLRAELAWAEFALESAGNLQGDA